MTKKTAKIWIAWETQRRSIELARKIGCKLYIIEQKGWLRYPRSILETVSILRQTKPEKLFVQNPSMILATVACIYKYFNKICVIIDRHTTFLLDTDYKNSPGIILFKLLSIFTLKHADMTIVTNRALAEIVAQAGGHPFILPDPLPELTMNGKKELAGENNVLFISSFGIDEPINEVLQAASFLEKNICIYISGNHKKLDNSILKSAPSNIIFTGFMSEEEFNTILFSVDVVMALTTAESCILCGCYEAVSAGKPLITSNKKDLRDYFSGAVFVDNTAIKIADGIREVFAHLDKHRSATIDLKKQLTSRWNITFHAFQKETEKTIRVAAPIVLLSAPKQQKPVFKMDTTIINITEEKQLYKPLVEDFIDSLNEEKKHFNLDRDRYAKFELTLAAIDCETVVGLAGLENKLGFTRSLIMIRQEYHGKRLGKNLYLKLLKEAKKTQDIILGITEADNYKAENLQYSIGFKKAGQKDNLVYSFYPITMKGLFIYYLIRLVFPIIKIFRGKKYCA